jgi:uncharacterized repeat protein (TIGR03803 family)
MSKWTTALAVLIGLVSVGITTQSAQAQTFTTLYSFCSEGTYPGCPDVAEPFASLIQATNGDLYGTTIDTVFKITPDGTLTTLYTFCSHTDCTDGSDPNGLIEATDGAFYGTTGSLFFAGGAETVFRLTRSGALTTLYTFCSRTDCADGKFPNGLIQASDGNFYGTTAEGGVNANGGDGTVFKITPGGKLTTLYSFCRQSGCTDGQYPIGLIQATDGNFYGATSEGGAQTAGVVFKITPSGKLTTIYSFCSQLKCTDGDQPNGLIQATDGNFYGTTWEGGARQAGIVFKITPDGTLTTLYSFCSQSSSSIECTDGAFPNSGVIQGSDGNFYGTTTWGGANDGGSIFKLTPGGTLTTLYSCTLTVCTNFFDPGPPTGLMQATNGDLYGTSPQGGDVFTCIYNGTGGCGSVWRLSAGLGAFVETQTASGTVGAAVKILGTDLTGTTSVTFDGTPATFTVVSRSDINTTVPIGATTGFVQVVTPSGTLTSNMVFTVTL